MVKHSIWSIIIVKVLPLVLLAFVITSYTISSVKESIGDTQESITESEGNLLDNGENDDSVWSSFIYSSYFKYTKILFAAILDAWAVIKVLNEFKEWRNKGSKLIIKKISDNQLLVPEIGRDISGDGLFDYLLIQCASPFNTSFIMPINICTVPSVSNSVRVFEVGLILGFTGEQIIEKIQFESLEISLLDKNNNYLIKSRILKKSGIDIEHNFNHDDEMELLLKVYADNSLLKTDENYFFEINFRTSITNQNREKKLESLPVRIFLKSNSEKDDFTARLVA